MFDLPQSFLILPNPKSNAFSKTLRKTRLQSLRFLLQTPISNIPREYQQSIIQLRPLILQVLKLHPERVVASIGKQDIFSALILLQKNQGNPSLLWKQAIVSLLFQLQTLPEDFLWTHPIKQIILDDDVIEFEEAISFLSIGPLGISGQRSQGAILSWDELKNTGKSTHPFTRLSENIYFSLFDSNPFSMEEAHPDKAGNQLQLGGYSIEEWCNVLLQSMALIEEYLPEWWSEFPLFMNRIVPVGFYPQKHLSASYAESPGLAYLSLHPDLLTMTEALIHESQHSKINLLRLLDPVLHNGLSEWTTSPVRPDMRPLHGVLLAAHAFVPVAALHHRLEKKGHPLTKTPEFQRRRKEILQKNQEAITTIKEKGQPSKIGDAIIKGLEALHIATASV